MVLEPRVLSGPPSQSSNSEIYSRMLWPSELGISDCICSWNPSINPQLTSRAPREKRLLKRPRGVLERIPRGYPPDPCRLSVDIDPEVSLPPRSQIHTLCTPIRSSSFQARSHHQTNTMARENEIQVQQDEHLGQGTSSEAAPQLHLRTYLVPLVRGVHIAATCRQQLTHVDRHCS